MLKLRSTWALRLSRRRSTGLLRPFRVGWLGTTTVGKSVVGYRRESET